jgi:hypothetical protein
LWVKLRRTQCEHMSSGLPLKADIAQYSRHFAFVPIAAVGVMDRFGMPGRAERRLPLIPARRIRLEGVFEIGCQECSSSSSAFASFRSSVSKPSVNQA